MLNLSKSNSISLDVNNAAKQLILVTTSQTSINVRLRVFKGLQGLSVIPQCYIIGTVTIFEYQRISPSIYR